VKPDKKKAARLDDDSSEESDKAGKKDKRGKKDAKEPEEVESGGAPATSNNLMDDLLGMDSGPTVPSTGLTGGTGLEGLDFGGPSGSNAVPTQAQPTGGMDLLGDMMGQSNPPASSGTDFMSQNVFGNDAFGGQQSSGADAGGGWADAFGDGGNTYDLSYAKTALAEVLSPTTPGNK